jgi:hypothetical protein
MKIDIEDIQVSSINTGFIYIDWYENKYFTSEPQVKYDNFHTTRNKNIYTFFLLTS